MTKDYAALADAIAAFKGYTAPRGLSKAIDRLILNDPHRERLAQAAETPSIAYLDVGALERGPAPTLATMAAKPQESLRGADDDLAWMNARQIAQEVQSGHLSPSDIARHFYERAAAASELNAFISL